MGLFSAEKIFGVKIRESANDGSDFSNPDADYRMLFLGEDGLLHVKDSSGTVTSPYSSSALGGASYVGYNTAGGSFLNMTGWYAKKVTISATSLILSIDAHVKGNNGSNATAFGAALLADNAGAPGNVIALAGAPLDSTVASNIVGVLNTTARWVSLPLNAYVTAADYWICVGGTFGSAGTQLAYDGSGSDYSKATNYPGDGSVQAYSSGSNKHSIRALILT